ncbi:FAD-binding oxidoreductase [Pelomonas sp. P7]|uniref:FAD-binding oxidoreductase n=1 Tax=Pelomonas caseinilytica TaxID=2906763 RepID=A0ABS8XJQ9_9BURK|nr:FAD-binding oxidoreductase [Pelomonas sp. P7]MCE4538813.1 FAD-binding oxidoreductase [Pelomonas sp. P7]
MFEVTLLGGGVMGAATACFLARDHGAAVTVVERDPSYARASSSLSLSSIRQQFSQPVNIALSRWSLDFLRRAADELAVSDDRPALGLVEPGYLYLATEAGAAALRALHGLQRAEGVDVTLLAPAELAARFPWLAVDDLALGSLGLSGEGWFDGPALHRAFRRKAMACGARFVAAEAVGFETAGDRVTAVRCADGSRLGGDAFVVTAGAWSAPLGRALGLELPVHAKKRDVFVLETPAELTGCPLVIDPSGFWFRPEGRLLLAGGPPRGDDPDDAPLDAIDHGLFEAGLWPTLAARVPALEALRVRSAWAGYYEMNAFDHNGLAGRLPGYANAYAACGFSGHGMQQSPAVGWSMARLIAGLDAPLVQALSPQRLLDGRRLLEANVI